ncbi:MAG: iron ABC transporter permease [Filomicrobium sp.]
MSETTSWPGKAVTSAPVPEERIAAGRRLLLLSGCALALVTFVSLAVGPTGISIDDLPLAISAAIWGSDDIEALRDRLVLLELRLPRTLIGAFVGAALAVSGAMMQGMFRNPLADPGLIGVSAGAALFAVATIGFSDGLLSWWHALLGIYALPIAAFIGGVVTTALLVGIANRSGQVATATLLLAGIAFGALAGAATGLIAYMSDDQQLRDLTLWTMGSLSGATWDKVLAIAPFAVVLFVSLPYLVRSLNGLLLGESEAFHLGINVKRAKYLIVALTAAAVGASVAVAGVIGFVGIVVPHFVRLIAGPDHRVLLPAAALVGAVVLLCADVLARMLVAPAELPIGILMAIIGAPVFLHLILRRGVSG